MTTNVYCRNDLQRGHSASTQISPDLASGYWSGPNTIELPSGDLPTGGPRIELFWIDREEGITDGKTWTVTSTVEVGGSRVLLQVQVVGTLFSSTIAVQIGCGDSQTGWSSSDTRLRFEAANGLIYKVEAHFVSSFGVFDDVVFELSELQDAILPKIDHVVVLMMENRSLDNLLGWIHPSGSAGYDGLQPSFANCNVSVNDGRPVHVKPRASHWNVPSLDPGEEFDHVTLQISGNMQGFLSDYVQVREQAHLLPIDEAEQIMEAYSVDQLPIISTLATEFSVSDRWFASVPSQTWPNRGFVQTGSSDANVNNGDYEPWDITTVFDVFGANNLSWMVYNDGLLPSATKVMFLDKYYDNNVNFCGMREFYVACVQPPDAPMNQKLPTFSFVEPNFGVLGHDQSYHPPHDVRPGEHFLAKVYKAIQECPYRDKILFILLFDEHGGTYDHVEPPGRAQPPTPGPVASNGFPFDRFGVRVPAIIISSWNTPGTVFRSNTSTPLDHTSVLATLRDWQGLSAAFEASLPSKRIVAAPNLAYVLSETAPRPHWPILVDPPGILESIAEADDSEPLNGMQKSALLGAAQLAAGRPLLPMRAQAARLQLHTHGDGRRLAGTLQPRLPIR